MNITKAINYDNCTEQNFDIFNTVVQGEHEYPQRNPLKTHATIKYNVLGSEHKFKIEEVTAEGFHVFYPYSKKEESVITITKQKLRLIKEGATVMNEVPSKYPQIPVFTLANLETSLKVSIVVISFDKCKSVRRC